MVAQEYCQSLPKHLMFGNPTITIYLSVFIITAVVVYIDSDSDWYKKNSGLAKALPFIVLALTVLLIETLGAFEVINLGIVNLFRDRSWEC